MNRQRLRGTFPIAVSCAPSGWSRRKNRRRHRLAIMLAMVASCLPLATSSQALATECESNQARCHEPIEEYSVDVPVATVATREDLFRDEGVREKSSQVGGIAILMFEETVGGLGTHDSMPPRREQETTRISSPTRDLHAQSSRTASSFQKSMAMIASAATASMGVSLEQLMEPLSLASEGPRWKVSDLSLQWQQWIGDAVNTADSTIEKGELSPPDWSEHDDSSFGVVHSESMLRRQLDQLARYEPIDVDDRGSEVPPGADVPIAESTKSNELVGPGMAMRDLAASKDAPFTGTGPIIVTLPTPESSAVQSIGVLKPPSTDQWVPLVDVFQGPEQLGRRIGRRSNSIAINSPIVLDRGIESSVVEEDVADFSSWLGGTRSDSLVKAKISDEGYMPYDVAKSDLPLWGISPIDVGRRGLVLKPFCIRNRAIFDELGDTWELPESVPASSSIEILIEPKEQTRVGGDGVAKTEDAPIGSALLQPEEPLSFKHQSSKEGELMDQKWGWMKLGLDMSSLMFWKDAANQSWDAAERRGQRMQADLQMGAVAGLRLAEDAFGEVRARRVGRHAGSLIRQQMRMANELGQMLGKIPVVPRAPAPVPVAKPKPQVIAPEDQLLARAGATRTAELPTANVNPVPPRPVEIESDIRSSVEANLEDWQPLVDALMTALGQVSPATVPVAAGPESTQTR